MKKQDGRARYWHFQLWVAFPVLSALMLLMFWLFDWVQKFNYLDIGVSEIYVSHSLFLFLWSLLSNPHLYGSVKGYADNADPCDTIYPSLWKPGWCKIKPACSLACSLASCYVPCGQMLVAREAVGDSHANIPLTSPARPTFVGCAVLPRVMRPLGS